MHAGELGFQAERLAWDYSPPALAAGFLKPGLKPDGSKCDSFRDAEASLPPAEAGGSHLHQPTRWSKALPAHLSHSLQDEGAVFIHTRGPSLQGSR